MVARIDNRFDRLETEVTEMRAEMRQSFAELRSELRDSRRDLSARIDDTRRDMFHGAIAIFGSILAVFAVLLAQSL
jgi:predicted phage gp36 major capsid-like protein